MSVVHEPVEDGIGQGGLTDVVVPFVERKLAGDEGGFSVVPVIEYFEQVAT